MINSKKAFTIIEMLAVLTISLLITILGTRVVLEYGKESVAELESTINEEGQSRMCSKFLVSGNTYNSTTDVLTVQLTNLRSTAETIYESNDNDTYFSIQTENGRYLDNWDICFNEPVNGVSGDIDCTTGCNTSFNNAIELKFNLSGSACSLTAESGSINYNIYFDTPCGFGQIISSIEL